MQGHHYNQLAAEPRVILQPWNENTLVSTVEPSSCSTELRPQIWEFSQQHMDGQLASEQVPKTLCPTSQWGVPTSHWREDMKDKSSQQVSTPLVDSIVVSSLVTNWLVVDY